MARLMRPLLLILALLAAIPAQAAVTVTFWSHELGNSFPHAFITLRGVPDAGGAPVDLNYGFTAKSLSPAILMGTVKGRLDVARPAYMDGSDAQFTVVLDDARYAAMLRLVAAWDEKTGDARYNLNKRNCVHFVQAAARVAGLTAVEFPGLMKRPRSFLQAVAAANPEAVTLVRQHGKAYRAALPPLSPGATPAAPLPAPAR